MQVQRWSMLVCGCGALLPGVLGARAREQEQADLVLVLSADVALLLPLSLDSTAPGHRSMPPPA